MQSNSIHEPLSGNVRLNAARGLEQSITHPQTQARSWMYIYFPLLITSLYNVAAQSFMAYTVKSGYKKPTGAILTHLLGGDTLHCPNPWSLIFIIVFL